MERKVELSRVVDVLSREAGCPLLVAGPGGAVLAWSTWHPVPCVRAAGFAGLCSGAQAFSESARTGAMVRSCPKNGEPHLVVCVDAEPRAVVLAELWAAVAPGNWGRARRAARLLAAVVREALPPPPDPELTEEGIPSELLRQAVRDGKVAGAGLHRMRARYRLSWRELEVLVLYYLTAYGPESRARTAVGQALKITEGTVREYVRRLRRKLRLRCRRSPEVLAWARAEGLLADPSAVETADRARP